ncbi:hypothetical protein [Micromonospora maris]|uniref:Uncharacterized protein n=1 Tax=Micromonospora maris TaxID=1003110 RepID=A0A9X0I7L3_9ACTN|nr:hypothetical protein [Micromonospora maris]AEB43127.1 hypothetical protein VAB18032_10045 [Micromonospora maris AB-18-032]KUJ48494.1 hypothetical protein ADL17_05475 [Micromonospora maris]
MRPEHPQHVPDRAGPSGVEGGWQVVRWRRALAVPAPLIAMVLGAAMATQWEVGGGRAIWSLPAPARWMAENLPLFAGSEPAWIWRGPFFVSVLLTLPLVWTVTRHATAAPRCLTRYGLLAATIAIGLEYNSPGYGWVFDLVALLTALVGTVWCGVQGLRRGAQPRRVAWALVAALPLTPPAGFLTFWYLPPGLTMGILLAWAAAAIAAGRNERDTPNH